MLKREKMAGGKQLVMNKIQSKKVFMVSKAGFAIMFIPCKILHQPCGMHFPKGQAHAVSSPAEGRVS